MIPVYVAALLAIVLGALGLRGLSKQGKTAPGSSPEPVPGASPVETPAPAERYPYGQMVRFWAALSKVDPDLVAAVISWEQRSSMRWNPNAFNPDDPSYGLGQVTPYIGVRFRAIDSEADYIQLYDPDKNLKAAAGFLGYLLNDKRYPLAMAIQMYNEGEPNYWEGKRVPEYLSGVMGYLNKFKGE